MFQKVVLVISFVLILFGLFLILKLLKPRNLKAFTVFRDSNENQEENKQIGKLFLIPLMVWTFVACIATLMLLAVSGITLFYSFALFHGEFLLVTRSLPLTTGNIISHLMYPVTVFIMAIFLFVLAVTVISNFFGKFTFLKKIGLPFFSFEKSIFLLMGFLGIVISLEILKLISFSFLLGSCEFDKIFSKDQFARIEFFPVSFLGLLFLIVISLWMWRLRDKEKGM